MGRMGYIDDGLRNLLENNRARFVRPSEVNSAFPDVPWVFDADFGMGNVGDYRVLNLDTGQQWYFLPIGAVEAPFQTTADGKLKFSQPNLGNPDTLEILIRFFFMTASTSGAFGGVFYFGGDGTNGLNIYQLYGNLQVREGTNAVAGLSISAATWLEVELKIKVLSGTEYRYSYRVGSNTTSGIRTTSGMGNLWGVSHFYLLGYSAHYIDFVRVGQGEGISGL